MYVSYKTFGRVGNYDKVERSKTVQKTVDNFLMILLKIEDLVKVYSLLINFFFVCLQM